MIASHEFSDMKLMAKMWNSQNELLTKGSVNDKLTGKSHQVDEASRRIAVIMIYGATFYIVAICMVFLITLACVCDAPVPLGSRRSVYFQACVYDKRFPSTGRRRGRHDPWLA